jgi:uncharacterized protein
MSEEQDRDIRMWAMFCHLSALVGYVIPLGNIVGPLVVWQLKKDESSFIDENGREAVNFQISYLVYYVVSAVLILLAVGIVLIPILLIAQLVFTIIAAVKANDGESYRIPFIFRLL